MGLGMNPGGGNMVVGLGGGRKPTTVGREAVLDLDGTSCVTDSGLVFFSSGSGFPSLLSFIFSSSSFSGRSSLRRRGLGSLVLPRTIRLVSPWDTSSSVLMESCLKAKGEAADLDAEDGGAVSGAEASVFSEGSTFLTTRRTTFTTFLRVSPCSSAASVAGWSPSATAPLATPLSDVPFCSPSFLGTGSGSGL